jgi:hypothetical protein
MSFLKTNNVYYEVNDELKVIDIFNKKFKKVKKMNHALDDSIEHYKEILLFLEQFKDNISVIENTLYEFLGMYKMP